MSNGKFSFGWFMLAISSIIVFSTTQSAAANADSSPANSDSPIGANLHVLADWSSEYTFSNAFKQSRSWMTQANGIWDSKEQADLDLDANGYPRSLPASNDWSVQYRWVTTLMFNGIEGHYPAGEYIVLYDGTGTIEYSLDASKDFADSVQGRDVLNVVPGKTNAGISLSIKDTDPFNTGDYIHNIRVIMPGMDEHNPQTFHPTFLENIENYKVLRFMDWMRTNWDYNESGPAREADEVVAEWSHPLDDAEINPFLRQSEDGNGRSAELLNWSDRPHSTDSTFASEEGVPVEVMVELANTVHSDPWFNMPHMASDNYIENFARTVRNSLESDRRVYIEYSNEVWNSGFGQAQWVERQGEAEWPSASNSGLEKRLNWFGKRTAEMCNIWKEVYGAQADKVICVMGTQAANSWVGEQTLDCPLATELAPCHKHLDAVAIAPYFGQHIGSTVNEATVTEWTKQWDGGLTKLFNELNYGSQLSGSWISKTNLAEAKGYIDDYAAVASDRNIDMVAYEGGQHLVGVGSTVWNSDIAELFAEANRDPRMTALYREYFTHWNAAGGQMFTIFSSTGAYSQWGNWGIREYADSVNPVKQLAVNTFIAETSCSWDTCKAVADDNEPMVVTHQIFIPIIVAGE